MSGAATSFHQVTKLTNKIHDICGEPCVEIEATDTKGAVMSFTLFFDTRNPEVEIVEEDGYKLATIFTKTKPVITDAHDIEWKPIDNPEEEDFHCEAHGCNATATYESEASYASPDDGQCWFLCDKCLKRYAEHGEDRVKPADFQPGCTYRIPKFSYLDDRGEVTVTETRVDLDSYVDVTGKWQFFDRDTVTLHADRYGLITRD